MAVIVGWRTLYGMMEIDNFPWIRSLKPEYIWKSDLSNSVANIIWLVNKLVTLSIQDWREVIAYQVLASSNMSCLWFVSTAVIVVSNLWSTVIMKDESYLSFHWNLCIINWFCCCSCLTWPLNSSKSCSVTKPNGDLKILPTNGIKDLEILIFGDFISGIICLMVVTVSVKNFALCFLMFYIESITFCKLVQKSDSVQFLMVELEHICGTLFEYMVGSDSWKLCTQ